MAVFLTAGADSDEAPSDARPSADLPSADLPSDGGPAEQSDNLIAVPPPPFSDDVFPCSDCHDGSEEVNRTRRPLEDFHEEIILKHDEKNRWCLDCHDAQNRDKLHLASGELLDFEESYKLCGQCHGPKLRDWRAGDHGKRTGSWSGAKQYLLCVHCHNPHAPKFGSLQPLPPPVRPEDIR
ncbi:MAG: hypothetical protein O2923_05130 [Verrucomicrobia bacterium]|nr:hypothetical protein [Verrucomicrobiota bacterium]